MEEKDIAVMGAFADSLKRNNKQIRDDRAQAICEDAEIVFKRAIEDMEMERRRKLRDRENMLDMSPTNAQSLIVASDFKAEEYVKKEIQIGIELRNLEIKLEVARERYTFLFGKEV